MIIGDQREFSFGIRNRRKAFVVRSRGRLETYAIPLNGYYPLGIGETSSGRLSSARPNPFSSPHPTNELLIAVVKLECYGPEDEKTGKKCASTTFDETLSSCIMFERSPCVVHRLLGRIDGFASPFLTHPFSITTEPR